MKMGNKISIIVPVYNAEKTLQKCVSSLQVQTYGDVEIILVNDGSKDGSLALCQEFAGMDERIRVIDKPNGGVSSARNAGLDAATGDYIMFCDSDDWVEPDWCSVLYENLQPEGLSVCQVDDITVEGEVYPVDMELLDRKDYMHRPMLMCSPVNKLFSKSIIDKYNLRFIIELNLGEDFCFCMAYLSYVEGKVCYVYRKLYHYYISTGDSLSKSIPALQQCERFYQELASSMERIGIHDEQSIATRNRFVMSHFERFLAGTAVRTDISVKEKLAIANKVGHMESVVTCCGNGVKWGNPLYVWLMRHNKVRFAMVFLILRSGKKRLTA